MNKLFLTTALLSALALPALAQSSEEGMYLPGIDRGVRASDFIGKRVYVTEADVTGLSETAVAAANEDWQDAGEINDIMISLNGDTEAVLVDFGGFLGMGEKTVAVSMDKLTLVPDANSPDDYFIVFNGSKETLTNAPAFDRDMVFAADSSTMEGTVDTTPADDTAVADGSAPVVADPLPGEMVDLASWAEADLIGMRVYGPNDEDVGEISAVALDADGKVEGAVVDVGGFLGVGEKKVALSSDMLQLVTEADGEVWFRVTATQEQLEAMAPYAS